MIAIDVHIELSDDIEQIELDRAISSFATPMIGEKVKGYSFSWMRNENGK